MQSLPRQPCPRRAQPEAPPGCLRLHSPGPGNRCEPRGASLAFASLRAPHWGGVFPHPKNRCTSLSRPLSGRSISRALQGWLPTGRGRCPTSPAITGAPLAVPGRVPLQDLLSETPWSIRTSPSVNSAPALCFLPSRFLTPRCLFLFLSLFSL